MDGLASNHLWRPDLENGLGLERHSDYGLGLLVKIMLYQLGGIATPRIVLTPISFLVHGALY